MAVRFECGPGRHKMDEKMGDRVVRGERFEEYERKAQIRRYQKAKIKTIKNSDKSDGGKEVSRMGGSYLTSASTRQCLKNKDRFLSPVCDSSFTELLQKDVSSLKPQVSPPKRIRIGIRELLRSLFSRHCRSRNGLSVLLKTRTWPEDERSCQASPREPRDNRDGVRLQSCET